MSTDERTPLLEDHAGNSRAFGQDSHGNFHAQFCQLVGIPPSDRPNDEARPQIGPKTLYGRALRTKKSQERMYIFTAAVSNSLLLIQVVLGAAVTALGASASSHILITLFGATNTIIAGVVAYLKSRGQPMRAQMYRDDLERVVDEIENSEVMWLGISKKMNGYQSIDTYDEVTVRSEVARLTRLYDRAVRTNTMNSPEMYTQNGNAEGINFASRKGPVPAGPGAGGAASGAAGPTNTQAATPPPVTPVAGDPDESPATAAPKSNEESAKHDKHALGGHSKAASKDPAKESPKNTGIGDDSIRSGNVEVEDGEPAAGSSAMESK